MSDTNDLVLEAMNDLAPTIEETEAPALEDDQLPLGEEFASEEVYEEVAQPPQEVEEPVTAELDETFIRLSELGVDFGVRKGDLPPELHGAYDRLAGEAISALSSYEEQMREMQMAKAEMQQFAQKLERDPSKILLTMAVTKPDAFQEAVSAYEEMQSDERYRNMVIRELQAEAKLSAAERQQQVWEQRQVGQKIKVVTNATQRAAEKYGVEQELAEKMVALQIQANGGDIDPRAVDGVVSSLRPKGQVTAGPNKVQRVQQAPTQAVEGQGAPTGNSAIQSEASPGRVSASRSPFLELVRDASRRGRSR